MAKIIYRAAVLTPTYQCFRTKEKSVLVITLGSAERAENSGFFFSFEAIDAGFLSEHRRAMIPQIGKSDWLDSYYSTDIPL